ncbi:MAG: tRNA (adenosine(37)-N6)-dimethylallyltransferase MiaA [Eubacteriales bacterium]|jgi:tRNA dimethylallyltransferase
MRKIPIIVICGPTASGKTALSVALCHRLRGEVVSTDSMQIYRGMDIGTAKPTLQEREGIPHHMLDVADIWEEFDVAQYCDMARPIIEDIDRRGKIPVLAGGTGLYINTLVDNIRFSPVESDPSYRAELERFALEYGNEALHERLRQVDPESALRVHPNNRSRVIRALEVYRQSGMTISEMNRRSRQEPSPYDPCMIGLCYEDRQLLYRRIDQRVEEMIRQGLEQEVAGLWQRGWDSRWSSVQAIGYKEWKAYFEGKATCQQVMEEIQRESRRYAKRQMTWFRRDKRIQWICLDEQTTKESLLQQALAVVSAHQNRENELS